MRLLVTQQELGRGNEGNGDGIEIKIEGLNGDIAEKSPGTSIFLEYYEGKVQLHIWNEGKVDCQTIILKNKGD